ncbi:MAG TPA: hypothetical protein VGF97_13450 [Rhizomicrobium sp.]|jgi:hypothetical protein
MKPAPAVRVLPPDLLARASLVGNEYAWAISDIPGVIEATRAANLVSVGGQLQFRLPDGGTCECYWVEVDTYKSVDKAMPWNERVIATAEAASRDFGALQKRFDFMGEGRKAFPGYLDKLLADGRDPADAMCFVWDVLCEDQASAKGRL